MLSSFTPHPSAPWLLFRYIFILLPRSEIEGVLHFCVGDLTSIDTGCMQKQCSYNLSHNLSVMLPQNITIKFVMSTNGARDNG